MGWVLHTPTTPKNSFFDFDFSIHFNIFKTMSSWDRHLIVHQHGTMFDSHFHEPTPLPLGLEIHYEANGHFHRFVHCAP